MKIDFLNNWTEPFSFTKKTVINFTVLTVIVMYLSVDIDEDEVIFGLFNFGWQLNFEER